jgi:hypothetical protein
LFKKIKFLPINDLTENIIDPPLPSTNFIPSWYKEMSSFIDTKEKNFRQINSNEINFTLKKCAPFFDSIASGYTITLPCDIVFVDPEKNNGNRIIWKAPFVPVGEHSLMQAKNMPLPENKNIIWKWMFYYVIKTPPGYSCLFSHPKNIFDLPFFTLDGIVDTDIFPTPINFPFLIDKNFRGIIKMGTPICQIFPFKREKWKSSKEKFYLKTFLNSEKTFLMVSDAYKKTFWSKKSYK